MRKFYTVAIATLFSLKAFACIVETGNLKVVSNGDTYKIYVSGEQKNECLYADSSSLQVSILCKNGMQESKRIKASDTLHYQLTASTTIAASVIWYRWGKQVGRTDILNQCIEIGGNGLCFKHLGTTAGDAPEMSIELPPALEEVSFSFHQQVLVVNAPWPGELRVFDSMGQAVHFEDFGEGIFVYSCESLPPGHFYYLNVLVFRPQIQGGLISETFQYWH
jgi:hypothetical protein